MTIIVNAGESTTEARRQAELAIAAAASAEADASSADEARSAAEAAAVSSPKVYADTTAGLAATAADGTFWVRNGGFLKLYRKTGGVAVFEDDLPLASAVIASRAFGSTATQATDTFLAGEELPADTGPIYLHVEADKADGITIDGGEFNFPPGIAARRYNGTPGALTPVTNGQQLGYYDFRAYNDDGAGGGLFYNCASIDVKVNTAIAFGPGDTPRVGMHFYIAGNNNGAKEAMRLVAHGTTLGHGAYFGYLNDAGTTFGPRNSLRPRIYAARDDNEWVTVLDNKAASGICYVLRCECTGATANDYLIGGTSGVGNAVTFKFSVRGNGDVHMAGDLFRGGTKVLGAQGAAVADAAALTSVDGATAAGAPTQAEFNALVAEFNKLRTDLGATRTQLNTALARLRAHGIVAT